MRATRLAAAPAPSARARSLTRVRKQRLGGRAASSRELLLLVRSGVTSQTPFPRRPSPGSGVPQRAKAKGQPAMSPSQLAALWLGDSRERGRPKGVRAPVSPPPGPAGSRARRLGAAADRPGRAGRAIAVGGAGREGSRGRGRREAAGPQRT